VKDIKQKLFDERVISKGDKYSWGFDSKYDNKESFVNEFKDYNEDIEEISVEDFLVFSGNKIIIQYRGALEGEEYQNLKCEIISNGEMGISFIDIMYQFNNCAHDYLVDCDHHYFESLRYTDLIDETLVLSIRLGS
jgi:hypothetical protein